MSRDRSSRVRKNSRQGNERSDDKKNEEQESEYSSEKEAHLDDEKNKSISIKKERSTSSSSIRSNRRQSTELLNSDESENEGKGDTTYTKYESSSNDENVEIIDTVCKTEDFPKDTKSPDNRASESPDYNELTKRDKRRKSRKKRRKKNRSLDSNRTEDDEVYEEDGRSSERDLSRTRTIKKSRANVPRKSRRKKHASRSDSTGNKSETPEKELPITEILRKAQENPKIRYEEPLPLAKLTTDRIYVQRRNGFSAVKIPGDRSSGIFCRRLPKQPGPPLYPIRVAIIVQKIWNSIGFIHQGLLAGMALMHLLLMQTYFRLSQDFFEDYSVVSELYTNIFSYLVTMCVISAFDRFDLAQLDVEHYRDIYVDHSRSFLAIPLYIATFCLHQTNLLIDDNISLNSYSKNTTEIENNSPHVVAANDFMTWRKVTLAKDSLAVLAWLLIAPGPREDMLLTHLKAMEKYLEIPENSA